MPDKTHRSVPTNPSLGRLVDWRPWREELAQFAANLPILQVTEALSAIDRLRFWMARLAAVQTSTVMEARRQGSTWEEIASHAGLVEQSAWQRWRELDRRVGTPPSRLLVGDPPGRPWICYEHGTGPSSHHPIAPVVEGWWAGCDGCMGDDGPYGTVEAAQQAARSHTCWRQGNAQVRQRRIRREGRPSV